MEIILIMDKNNKNSNQENIVQKTKDNVMIYI